MKRRDLLIYPFLAIALASCTIFNKNKTNEQTGDSKEDVVTDLDLYEKDAYKSLSIEKADFSTRAIDSIDDVTYDDLFNLGNKITISLSMEKEELNKMQQDLETGYKSDIYRHCKSVTITMQNNDNKFSWTYEDVGIRQKGNMSRKEDGDLYKNGVLGTFHFKLSFDETFDSAEAYGTSAYSWAGKEDLLEERENRNFLGLSGIDVKWNRTLDETHIKEVYASKLYKAVGVLSQDIGLSKCHMTIEGDKDYDLGLCVLYEPCKKSMVKRHLQNQTNLGLSSWKDEKKGTYGVTDSNYGDLYKCSWGVNEGFYAAGPNLTVESAKGKRVGVGNLSGSYIPAYERKTNTDISYDDQPLRNLIDKISNGDYNDIKEVLDLEYFAKVEACNYVIGNPDDLRNNNNNYMIYIRRTDGKAIIIPIDNDRCFGIKMGWNPDNDGLRNAEVFAKKNASGKTPIKIYQNTILSSSANDTKAIYLNYVKAIKASDWMKTETFNSLYEIAKKTYGIESCASDFLYVGFSLNAIDNYTFNDYITKKAAKIDLEYTLTVPKTSTNTNTSTKGDYGDVYVAGTFNNWNPNLDSKYKMTYNGNGVYTITLTVNGDIEFKFNNGSNWDTINWGEKDSKLSLEGGSNFKYTVSNNSVTITINTITKEITIA